jgi:16S rRNA (adenine1518-N6/adenine1519-N6)-dimethyltransferase
MSYLKPKKSLGQHFLKDENIANKIVQCLQCDEGTVIEIGPGQGVLSRYIIDKKGWDPWFVETDSAAVEYLEDKLPAIKDRLIKEDFLRFDIKSLADDSLYLIGNLPYNISSQVFFRLLEHRNEIIQSVFMIQKEVAERIASPPGNKKYGILSVLLQAYYGIDYLFTVQEHVFHPPPKVKSAVIRLSRNNVKSLDCDEELFFRIVKTAFNQRRKTLRNALKPLGLDISKIHENISSQRAEQLTVNDFVTITRQLEDS